MDTCVFKREHVIRSDNVWLSEVMSREPLQHKGSRGPPWSISGFQTRFLVVTGGRYYPTAIREHTQDFHKNPTRITLESHKIFTRIPSVLTRISQDHSTETSGNPAEITSVFHAKTLEYVCHTGRTHEPLENSCGTNETKGLSHVSRQVTHVIHRQTCVTVVKQRDDSSFDPR